jgi:hypothetical protein
MAAHTHGPNVVALIFAIVIVACAVGHIMSTNYMIVRLRVKKESVLSKADTWSEDKFSIWWLWWIALWVFLALLIAVTGTISGGGFVFFMAMTRTVWSVRRAWHATRST